MHEILAQPLNHARSLLVKGTCTGLPDCMNNLAKLLSMLFVFLCKVCFLAALTLVWLNYSENLATLERYKHALSEIGA